jgi:hypothetical protein
MAHGICITTGKGYPVSMESTLFNIMIRKGFIYSPWLAFWDLSQKPSGGLKCAKI